MLKIKLNKTARYHVNGQLFTADKVYVLKEAAAKELLAKKDSDSNPVFVKYEDLPPPTNEEEVKVAQKPKTRTRRTSTKKKIPKKNATETETKYKEELESGNSDSNGEDAPVVPV